MFDQHQRHIAPRVAKSVHASHANTPKMSVAALLAASPVAVPSDAVSPDVASLPTPVAQPKTLTPEEHASRLDKAFDDLAKKGCFFSGLLNLMCGKTPDEMSTEAQAALNKISQAQVPEQVERGGFESHQRHGAPKERLGADINAKLGRG